MPHPKFPNLTVLDHPLIQHRLSILRDKDTPTKDFKQLVNEIAMLMAYEVTKALPLETAEVETPLERMRGVRVAGKKLALVPILRAGLGMVEGIAQLIPSARVGQDRKSTRLNSSHLVISYAVFCLKKKKQCNTADECP